MTAANWAANGVATLAADGSYGSLTPATTSTAGSLIYRNMVDARWWDISFDFAMVGGSSPPADGFCLFFQASLSVSALGAGGGAFGYGGITGGSLCLAVDSWSATTPQIPTSRIFTNGAYDQFVGACGVAALPTPSIARAHSPAGRPG